MNYLHYKKIRTAIVDQLAIAGHAETIFQLGDYVEAKLGKRAARETREVLQKMAKDGELVIGVLTGYLLTEKTRGISTEATRKFAKGDRVSMSALALSLGCDGPQKRSTGVVDGFSVDRKRVRIHRDGDAPRSKLTYTPNIWEKI